MSIKKFISQSNDSLADCGPDCKKLEAETKSLLKQALAKNRMVNNFVR
jgi:hypothetical protein